MTHWELHTIYPILLWQKNYWSSVVQQSTHHSLVYKDQVLSNSVILLLLIYPHNTYMSDNCWAVPDHLVWSCHLYCVIVAIMIMSHSGALGSALTIPANHQHIQAARYQVITKCITGISSPSLPHPCSNLLFCGSVVCTQNSCKVLLHSSCQISRDHKTYC